jgi:hypothetical protein
MVGLVHWANKLNLEQKKNHDKWKPEDIKNKIFEVMKELNINRMPSQQEVLSIEKDHELCNMIKRSLGFYGWAKELNLEIKDSETFLGITFQEKCADELINKGYKVENTTTQAVYDLLVNNNIRIDVKSGCAYLNKDNCRLHSFGINKKYPSCDLYIIYALDELGKSTERTFIIPSKELKLITMCIGKNSKYNEYINRWDLIDIYDKFYKFLK